MDSLTVVSGADSGIGLEIVSLLVERNCSAVALVLDQNAANTFHKKFPDIPSIQCNLRCEKQRIEASKQILQLSNDRSITLVNNAGYLATGPTECLPIWQIENSVEINVLGPIHLTQLLLPAMLKFGGRVINMSSGMSTLNMSMLGAYCASKSALDAFNDSLRRELVNTDVKICLIWPGTIRTKFLQKSQDIVEEVKNHKQFPRYKIPFEKFLRYVRYGRENFGLSTEDIRPILSHALFARYPKTHYYALERGELLIWMYRFLPTWWIDKQMRNGFLTTAESTKISSAKKIN